MRLVNAGSFFVYGIIVILLGCTSSSDIKQNIERSQLEGNWEKIKPETELGGYKINIKFKESKFYYTLFTYVDYIDGNDPCVKSHGWREYSLGEYLTDTEKLYFNGNWCDSTFTKKHDSGCFNTGIFKESYYFYLSNDTLILNKNEDNFDDKKQYNHVYDKTTFVKR
jgi:hypothetical protein